MKKVIKITAIIVVFMFAATITAVVINGNNHADAAIVRAGSNTADIRAVQSRLKEWGFYAGSVDGIYGNMTVAAVRRFQQKHNLTVDGIAGPNTLGKMGVAVGLTVNTSIIRSGSNQADVRKVQQRLRDLGYYRLSIDGIYGNGTTAAVRRFQADNSLTQDGITGPKTLGRLGIRITGGGTPAAAPAAGGITNADIHLMARAIYAEARGEPHVGKVAVGAVILNRLRSPDFPNTIAGVIYQPRAFTAVADGQINLSPDSEAQRAAQDALNGWDPSHGAIYYYNPAVATSQWIFSRPIIITIGKHVFCS